jgi:hypothetical protein
LTNAAKAGCPPIAKVPTSRGTQVTSPAEAMSVKVFPNPTTTNFNLQVITAGTEAISVRLMDVQGRMLKTLKVSANQTVSIGSELKAGAYLVEVRQGNEVKTTRLMKF